MENAAGRLSNPPGQLKTNSSSRRAKSAVIQTRRLNASLPEPQSTVPANSRLPTRETSLEVSDGDDMSRKKRKLENGTSEKKFCFKQLMEQLHDQSQVIQDASERLMAEKTAQVEEIRELKAKLEECEQTELNNTALLCKYKTSVQTLVADNDILKQRYDQSLQSRKELEKQHAETAQQCESLHTRLDHSSAEHAVSISGLLEDKQKLEQDLKKSDDELARLQSLRLSCADPKHNEKQLKIVKLLSDFKEFRTTMETQLAANKIKHAQLDKLQRLAEEEEDARALRRENDELREKLTCSEKLVTNLRAEVQDVILAVKSQTEAIEDVAYSSAEASVANKFECAESKLDVICPDVAHKIEKQNSWPALDVLRRQCRQREQFQQVVGIMRYSHDRASRSLHAVLHGSSSMFEAQKEWATEKAELIQAHEALSLDHSRAQGYASSLRAQLQAFQREAREREEQISHAVSQEAEKLRNDLHASDTGLAQLDARYQQLNWQHRTLEQQHNQHISESNKRIEDRTAEAAQCTHAIAQLEIQLAATNKQSTIYSDLLYQQSVKLNELTSLVSEKDLTISHLRACRVAMKWHITAIKKQRDSASLTDSTTLAEIETQRREMQRFKELLQTARLARTRAEDSRGLAEAELHETAGQLNMANAELRTLRTQESVLANEIDTLKSKNDIQLRAIQEHEACAAEKKWLDDRYQDTLDQVLGQRGQLAASRSQMVDSGTDAMQPLATAERPRLTPIINRSIALCGTHLATPAPSTSPTQRSCNDGDHGTAPSSVVLPPPRSVSQLPTPIQSTGDIALPKRPRWSPSTTPARRNKYKEAPPTQENNFERKGENQRSYQRDSDLYQARRAFRRDELFSRRGSRVTCPPMGGRSLCDTYRPPY